MTHRPLLLCVLAAALVLTGCSTSAPATPAASGPALPKYYDARSLLDAVGSRERADGGVLTVLNGTLDPPGSGTPQPGDPAPAGRLAVTGDGALSFRDGGVAARFDQRLGAAGTTPRTTAAVRIQGRTWLRLPDAGRWSEVGRGGIDDGDRTDAALATNVAGTADPLAGVGRYADAALVADAADERVDGTATVRYTIVVDLVRAAAAETDPGLRAQLTAQTRSGLTRISTVIWVDADQRPVRGRMRQEVPDAGTLDLVTDYRSWGTAVTVDPPA